jgi:hypothetical protein
LGEANRKPVRYIATKGVREIARGDNLLNVLNTVSKLEEGNSVVGFTDVVVWDMGTVTCPMMSIVASTCRGWLTINIKGRQYLSDNFGISFTPREVQVLKQFFEVWKLESGMTVSTAIKNIYEQSYVKDFKPGPGQIKLNRDEFKVLVSKLLGIVKHVPDEKQSN